MELSIEKYHLKSTSLFEVLSKADSLAIKNLMVRKEYAKGEYIFKEKSFSRGIYIVRRGKVKIFQQNNEGRQSIVYIYKKGDYFGYRPILADEPHPVSAMAMENVVISFLSREIFTNLITKYPFFARQLLVNLSKEFSVWINKMTVFSQYGVRERVALGLLILDKVYQKTGETGNAQILISRDDFAGFVGTAKETLVRMLRNFKDEQLITSKGTKITILKYRSLTNMISD